MTEFEIKLLGEIENLKQAINSISSDFTISQITYFENLPPMAVVGVDYVSYRFMCSESAVVRGRFETYKIPRLRKKPLAFVKSDVDAVWMTLNKSISEIAAKLRQSKIRKN